MTKCLFQNIVWGKVPPSFDSFADSKVLLVASIVALTACDISAPRSLDVSSSKEAASHKGSEALLAQIIFFMLNIEHPDSGLKMFKK